MEAANLLSLDENARRCIMLLLPVPDLLRLSATCRELRLDLFSLLRGELAVQLNISLRSRAVVDRLLRCYTRLAMHP